MKNFVLILFLSVILVSCKDPNVDSSGKTTEELLSTKAWKLDKYTNTSGGNVNTGSLNPTAETLFDMIFEFRKNSEVRGYAKTTKTPINGALGVWKLDNDKILNIDMTGLGKGNFEIVRINSTTLILKATTEEKTWGLTSDIHMVFSHFDL